jgi:hypothetical protein
MTITKRFALAGAAAALMLGLGACASAPAGKAGGDNFDRHVLVVNGTSVAMREFYASNVERTDWEEDILGTDILPAGRSVNINIDDGSGACLYDFKAVFVDGDVLIRNRINVCQISTYTYTE